MDLCACLGCASLTRANRLILKERFQPLCLAKRFKSRKHREIQSKTR